MNINKTREIQIVSYLTRIFIYIVCDCRSVSINDNNRDNPNNTGVSDF